MCKKYVITVRCKFMTAIEQSLIKVLHWRQRNIPLNFMPIFPSWKQMWKSKFFTIFIVKNRHRSLSFSRSNRHNSFFINFFWNFKNIGNQRSFMGNNSIPIQITLFRFYSSDSLAESTSATFVFLFSNESTKSAGILLGTIVTSL